MLDYTNDSQRENQGIPKSIILRSEKEEQKGTIPERVNYYFPGDDYKELSEEQVKDFLENSISKPVKSMTVKELVNHINNNMVDVVGTNRLYVYGVTVTNPRNRLDNDPQVEWNNIEGRISDCINSMFKIPDINFILFTIEEHAKPSKKKKGGKIKIKSDEEYKGLDGYPHVHFAIGFNHRESQYDACDLGKYFYNEDTFLDVKVGSKKITGVSTCTAAKGRSIQVGDNFEFLIRYVLKNSRHLTPFQKLGNCYPTTLLDLSVKGNDSITNFFMRMSKFNFGIPFNYYDLRKEEVENKFSLKAIIVPGKNTPAEALCYVKKVFEEGEYYCVKGKIFQRIFGSRNSYSPISMSNKDFYVSLYNDDTINLLSKNMKAIVDILNNPNQNALRKLTFNYEWIEFADFFLNVVGRIDKLTTYRTCNQPCFLFYPNYTHEDFMSRLKPKTWYSIIENQDFSYEEIVSLMGKLSEGFLPPVEGSKAAHAYGVSGSGKSVLFGTIADMKGKGNVITQNEIASPHSSMIYENANMPIQLFEEIVGFRNLSMGQKLQILESYRLENVNRKNDDITTEIISVCLTVIINNVYLLKTLPSNTPEEQISAIERRLDSYYFGKPYPLEKCIMGVRKLIAEEHGAILMGLLVAKAYGIIFWDDDICKENLIEYTESGLLTF